MVNPEINLNFFFQSVDFKVHPKAMNHQEILIRYDVLGSLWQFTVCLVYCPPIETVLDKN